MTEKYRISFKVEGKSTLSDTGKRGNMMWFIALASVFILFVFFVYRTVTDDARFWIFAVFSLLLVIAFGPYQIWIKKFYFFGWREDNKLVLRSVINFIPHSYIVDLSSVKIIKFDSPLKSSSLIFYDYADKVAAKFNPFMINQIRFNLFLKEILEQNKHIEANL